MGLCGSKPDGRYEAGSKDAAGPKPTPEPPVQGSTQHEVDKFDESTAAGSKTAQNRLTQRLSGGDSMRRQGENAPTSSTPDGSAKISGRLPSERLFESSATEFWDKSEHFSRLAMSHRFSDPRCSDSRSPTVGKMAFVDSDNTLCERLLMGLSRVKVLGSGGFASVFSARWRHVSRVGAAWGSSRAARGIGKYMAGTLFSLAKILHGNHHNKMRFYFTSG